MASAPDTEDFVADINVTPFVDVMLVLLIIFMVTAPMMTEGLDVDLPKVAVAEILSTENDHMILSIKSDGTLFLDEYPTSLADLDALLRSSVVAPGRQLFLRADRQVEYGIVMEVMGQVRAVGISNLGMIAESCTGAVGETPGRNRKAFLTTQHWPQQKRHALCRASSTAARSIWS